MADRVMVIAQLGSLAMDAAQRGDDRAAECLRDAIGLLVEDGAAAAAAERRREKDRKRKRHSKESADSAESADSTAAPSVFPHTPFPTPPEATTQRRAREDDDETRAVLADTLRERLGDGWQYAREFLQRRDASTWLGWMREMSAAITGGNATEADLIQALRDDAALDRRIASPKGLRAFVADAVRERRQHVGRVAGTAPTGRGALLYGKIVALIEEIRQPGQPVNRFIRRAKVIELGPDVVRAYDAVGGAKRFLDAEGDHVSFLIRDFTAALEASRASA